MKESLSGHAPERRYDEEDRARIQEMLVSVNGNRYSKKRKVKNIMNQHYFKATLCHFSNNKLDKIQAIINEKK